MAWTMPVHLGHLADAPHLYLRQTANPRLRHLAVDTASILRYNVHTPNVSQPSGRLDFEHIRGTVYARQPVPKSPPSAGRQARRFRRPRALQYAGLLPGRGTQPRAQGARSQTLRAVSGDADPACCERETSIEHQLNRRKESIWENQDGDIPVAAVGPLSTGLPEAVAPPGSSALNSRRTWGDRKLG
jgi:hypothetical protein